MNQQAPRPAAPTSPPPLPAWSRTWPWLVFIAMASAASLLGYLGFRELALAAGEPERPLNLAYRTVQLFVLESGNIQGAVPWQLEIARVLAPLVPAWAVFQALLVVFRDQREAFWLRRRKGHIVVCGLGRKGMQLVGDFRSAGEDVVVIECDEDNPRLASCRYLGAHVLVGSCTDASLLQRARVDRAERVFAITGDDGTNVETAILVHQQVRARAARIRGTVTCHVHVVGLKLCTLLEDSRILSGGGHGFAVRIFNSFQNSARALLTTHPLEPERFGADDPRRIHLIIIGFGKMGESVALQAMKLGHYANGKRLRITVIDEQAQRRQAAFVNRHPQLDRVCDVGFVAGNDEDPGVCSQLRDWVADPESVVSIAVCLDGDSASLACGLNVVKVLGSAAVPIFLRMSDVTGLARLFDHHEDAATWRRMIHVFGMTSLSATRELLLADARHTLARAFHEDYRRKRRAEGKPESDPAMRDWSELDVDLQDSNRQLADHLAVKLRAIGCRVARGPAGSPLAVFEVGEVELLARMEHARWCAERFLAGWRPGPTDHAEKINANLVAWEELEDGIREYDRQTVRCIPGVLDLIGQHVERTAIT